MDTPRSVVRERARASAEEHASPRARCANLCGAWPRSVSRALIARASGGVAQHSRGSPRGRSRTRLRVARRAAGGVALEGDPCGSGRPGRRRGGSIAGSSVAAVRLRTAGRQVRDWLTASEASVEMIAGVCVCVLCMCACARGQSAWVEHS